jgi:hypothetical protein
MSAPGRYDRADRSGPQILVGEYGAQDGRPTPTLRAAVGEATFDLVHESQSNWPTNMIGLDAATSYGSPSYWVFSNNLGNQVLGSRLAGAGTLKQVVTRTVQGGQTIFYVKLVNATSQIQSARLTFQGVSRIVGTGTKTVLTGNPSARNTLAAPDTVVPVTQQVTGLGLSTRMSILPNSVTVLRVTGR